MIRKADIPFNKAGPLLFPATAEHAPSASPSCRCACVLLPSERQTGAPSWDCSANFTDTGFSVGGAQLKTILILEDEPIVMRILRAVLKDYTILQAQSAEEARRLVIEHGE